MSKTNNSPFAYFAVESATLDTDIKVISKADKKDITFYALLQEGDVLNRNMKIYPSEIIWQAAQTEYIKTMIETKAWVGEANHPQSKDLARQLYIDKRNVSHTILTFDRKGNNFYGKVRTYRNEMGASLMGAIEQEAKVAFSLRGVHHLEKNAKGINVVKQLAIYTYDWVDYPSHRAAYIQHVIAGESSAHIIPISQEWMEMALANESSELKFMLEDFTQGIIKEKTLNTKTNTVGLATEGGTVHIPLRKMSLGMLRSTLF